MESQSAKQSRIPVQLLVGIALGGVAAAAVIIGFSSLTQGKGVLRSDVSSTSTLGSENEGATSNVYDTTATLQKRTPDVEELADLLSHQGNFGLSAALHKELEHAGAIQLQGLLERSKAIEHNSRRQLVQSTIFRRYASLDPKSAVRRISDMPRFQHGDLLATVFGEWSLLHLDDAVNAAKQLDGFGKIAALRGILESRDDLSDDVRIEIGRQLGSERVAQNVVAQANITKAVEDPRSAWNTLIGDDLLDTAQTGLLIQVAQVWVEKDGMSVLGTINDTLADWTTKTSVLTAVIHELVQADAQAVFDFVSTMEGDNHNTLIMNVVNAWARLDPEAALVAVQSVESKNLRTSLEYSIASSWGRSNPREVLENLDRLPENAQDAARSSAISTLAQTAPEEAANLMAGMDRGEHQLMTAFQVLSTWASKDAMAALEWALNNPEIKDLRGTLLPSILYQVARIDPQLAFDTALQQPIGANQIGLEAQVISNISIENVEKALALLSLVREGLSLNHAFTSVGSALVRNGDVDQAWNLANRLPESQRESYYRSVVDRWAANDGTKLYESIDKLPSDEIKSHAALKLISFNTWSRNLNDDEINHARTYLNEQDAKSVEKHTQETGRRVGVEFMDLGASVVSGAE